MAHWFAVDFIPFQLEPPDNHGGHRNGQPHSPPASSPDRGAWDSRGLPDTYVDMSQYLGIGQEGYTPRPVWGGDSTPERAHAPGRAPQNNGYEEIHGINLLLLKPVVEAALPEGIALRIHSGIIYGIIRKDCLWNPPRREANGGCH